MILPDNRSSDWKIVARALEDIPLREHPTLLAYLEERARQSSDLESLRAIKDYRRHYLPSMLTCRERRD